MSGDVAMQSVNVQPDAITVPLLTKMAPPDQALKTSPVALPLRMCTPTTVSEPP